MTIMLDKKNYKTMLFQYFVIEHNGFKQYNIISIEEIQWTMTYNYWKMYVLRYDIYYMYITLILWWKTINCTHVYKFIY